MNRISIEDAHDAFTKLLSTLLTRFELPRLSSIDFTAFVFKGLGSDDTGGCQNKILEYVQRALTDSSDRTSPLRHSQSQLCNPVLYITSFLLLQSIHLFLQGCDIGMYPLDRSLESLDSIGLH